ncbi:MAG: acyl-CoA desaturase [Planctomycetota bacterium]
MMTMILLGFHAMANVIDAPSRGAGKTAGTELLDSQSPTDESSGSERLETSESDLRTDAQNRRRFANISWWALGWLGFAHIVVIAVAPFTFTWTGLAVAVALHWLTGSIGICLCYHRLLTHSGMKTPTWMKYALASVGCLAGEGAPLDWVADHRKHHKHSDQEGDPHSPHDGAWWSHMFWLAFRTHNGDREGYLKKWAPDLYKLRGMRMMDYFFLPIHFACGLMLLGIGYAFGGMELGISLVVWGMFVRLVTVLHATWMVNSASHMWGYKNYETTDDSRNNWFVAIIAYGEGWHNNHHAHPRMAKHGHKWWEFDITWQAIKALRAVGLVWDVVDYRTAAEKKERESAKTAP